jgi:uncharacterized membrane protein YeaQ/YmgE (transglycosylase-associated protein family)
MTMHIVYLLIVGFLAGAVARFLLPGKDPFSLFGTLVVGIAGSLIGGFLSDEIFYHHWTHTFHTSGFIGSVIGSLIILIIARIVRSGGRRDRV